MIFFRGLVLQYIYTSCYGAQMAQAVCRTEFVDLCPESPMHLDSPSRESRARFPLNRERDRWGHLNSGPRTN